METELEKVPQWAINSLREVLDIQLMEGNWNFNPYMHGMANGMILMMALLENKEPEFKKAPQKWITENTCKGTAFVEVEYS